MPQRTEIEPSVVSRIAAGLRYALTGAKPNEWFGPMQPLPPALEGEQALQAGVTGRQFDYRTGFNVDFRPRSGEAVGFPQLRALADNCDVLRLVVETRKDQICALPWAIQYRGGKKKPDGACEEVTRFLRCPDGEHAWDEWLRMLLEDLFVIDAPTLYIRKTVGGDLFALEPMDGATIKRLIDVTGRTPAEGAAYQQILKGVPAVDYAREELIYKPRNVRTHKIYGFSPVEQVINTVNIALRRQLAVGDYFTSGTVPDALAGVPETWTIDQISEFQAYWDGLLASEDGNFGERRKLKFVPGEIAKNFKETKQPPLKDQFDEWLARVICYCFSIDCTPFVAQVNRSVAETNREQSLIEGLAPAQQWIKSLIDRILIQCFGRDDLEFSWQEGEVVDPVKRATVLTTYVEKKVMHPDEARDKLGLPPLTPEQKADMFPPPPPMLAAPEPEGVKAATAPGEPPEKDPPEPPADGSAKEALSKAKKSIRQIDRERSAVTDARATLTEKLAAFFCDRKAGIISQIVEASGLEKSSQSGTPGEKARRIVDGIDVEDWSELAESAKPVLVGMVVDGGEQGLAQLGISDDDVMRIMRDDAKGWAADRAAELVGMKWDGDEIVPNPDAKWQIADSTRDFLRADVEQALEEGWSSQELSARLADNYAFSDARADMIARTEIAFADAEGTRIGWRASGVVAGREWDAAPDCCDECQAMHGEIAPLDGTYKGGAEVPLHPQCRCDELPILDEDMN